MYTYSMRKNADCGLYILYEGWVNFVPGDQYFFQTNPSGDAKTEQHEFQKVLEYVIMSAKPWACKLKTRKGHGSCTSTQ